MQRRQWEDLTTPQKIGVVIAVATQALLLAAAQWDITRRPADQINGSKLMWRSLVLINYVGPLAYFIIGRKRPPAA